MSKWGWVDKKTGDVYLQYCPKCGKENHAFFVAKGKCCWCGHEANPEDVEDENKEQIEQE